MCIAYKLECFCFGKGGGKSPLPKCSPAGVLSQYLCDIHHNTYTACIYSCWEYQPGQLDSRVVGMNLVQSCSPIYTAAKANEEYE